MTELGKAILHLRKQGKSYKQIQAELNCSRGSISYYLNPEEKTKAIARSLAARKRRLVKLNEIKESKPCTDCGKFFEGFLMDFDHLPGHIKIERVSTLIQSSSWKSVLGELSKCELVCCMCHRIRTKDRWLTNPLLGE